MTHFCLKMTVKLKWHMCQFFWYAPTFRLTLFGSEHVSTRKVNTVQIDAPGLPDPGSDRMEQ